MFSLIRMLLTLKKIVFLYVKCRVGFCHVASKSGTLYVASQVATSEQNE